MISVVIPVFNEAESIKELYQELILVLRKLGQNYEIIFVNDGSNDQTQAGLEKIFRQNPKIIKIIQFENNFGKANALAAGFHQAKGEVIITLDGDLQDDPKEIPNLLNKLNEGYDLVSGWKSNRQDPWFKKISSKIFNRVNKIVFKINLHDFNCGFKAYRNEAVKELNLYGELHRFIPAMVAANGFKVGETPIKHRKRKFGQSKYGTARFFHGFFDLMTVLFMTKFRLRPLHLFGYIGLGFFTLGFGGGIYLAWIKIVEQQLIGQRPLLLLSVMLMIMGVQIGITGLISEQIAATTNKKQSANIKRRITEAK